MDFSSKNKKTLQKLADQLELEVDAKRKNKPTLDELIHALEAKEKEDPEAVAAALQELGIEETEEDDEDEEEDEDDGSANTGKSARVKGQVFTYVGKGESSPNRINFMGRQQFKRGVPVTVTDPLIIKKLTNNPTFVQGEADPDMLQDIEDEGAEHAERIRSEDKKMDAQFRKEHGGAGE